MLKALAKLLLFSVLFVSGVVRASEPLFGYVYTTDTLPEGKWELEQWITDREGQAHGHFHHVDMSTEAEFGVTDRFQLALYANYMYASESGNSVRGKTEGIEIPYDHDRSQSYNQARFDGFSVEALYRVFSPYIDPVGLAFYLEPDLGRFENGLEIRSILQKNFFEDQLVLAMNFWVEFDREQSSNLGDPADDPAAPAEKTWSDATYAEIDLGASYRVAPHWFVGLELRNHNEFAGWDLDHSRQDHTAFFFGPNVHYASERWFATLSILRQLHVVAYTDDQRAQTDNGRLYGDEHTTWDGIRLKVGFPF
jgi:hypothetical protein